MSRIFDALQRSGVEQTGVEYADTMSVATRLLVPLEPETTPPASTADLPSIAVSVTAESRLVFLTGPESLAAEKFRLLGVRMRQLQQTRPLKRVLVTSTMAEEGKSLVSANLAGVLARRKRQKVLLIEGDLRRPMLSAQFGLSKPGIAEWLRSESSAVENVYYLEDPDFWFLPAGRPPENPPELLQSGRLSLLMGQLSTLFDWIIIDSPPLLPLADTTVWAKVSDGALLVVREGMTERTPLLSGLEILKKSDLLGVVLNACTDGNHHNYYQRYAAERK
jgi:protein-tyrosine kinase